MDELSLELPAAIVESLPADGDDAARDMELAVEGWEERVNRGIRDADDADAAAAVVDALELLENRLERYDDFVVELRAWGQSPIYAIAWRNLHASLVRQIHDHEDVAAHVDRERHARLVDDGIRLRQARDS